MTPREAIKELKTVRKVYANMRKEYKPCVGALNSAISALEKQIPKKPKVIIDTWSCPTCAGKVEYQMMLGENILYHGGYDFCPKCGQAIDWSEC